MSRCDHSGICHQQSPPERQPPRHIAQPRQRAPLRRTLRERLRAFDRDRDPFGEAALDAIGSAAVMAALAAKHMDELPAKRLERFAKLGTIDLRIDYLRPGIGEYFTIHAQCLRVGSRVGTARMDFCGPDGTMMSAGAAAYIVS